MVYIIAEAGVNHNGSFEIAKKLIEEAKYAGVDAVKFQLFKSENLVTANAQKAEYQKNNTNDTNNAENQLEMLKKLEMSFDDQKKLMDYATSLSIDFITSPFDLESIDQIESMNLKFIKIPSGEITNYPYLKKISKISKKDSKIILSTGMCNLQEIKEAIDVLNSENKKEIFILHCNTEYPTPMEDVNLNAMETIRKEFLCQVGYSDHTQGIEVPISAVALGATIIEKHFTLDKNMEGPDHKASLDTKELKEMVDAIRNIEKAMGNGKKEPSKSENKNKEIARKSIVAKEDIKIGDIFTEKNLTTKRPATGISPMKWEDYIGKPSKENYKKDDFIK